MKSREESKTGAGRGGDYLSGNRAPRNSSFDVLWRALLALAALFAAVLVYFFGR